MKNGFNSRDLVRDAVQIVRVVHRTIRSSLQQERAYSLKKIRVPSGDGYKDALRIDDVAESRCKTEFMERYENKVLVIGEESLPDDLSKVSKGRICILVDMVDGTDLLEMNIPMWCSAIVIFDPDKPKILGAVVGQATGEIYFASAEDDAAFVCRDPSVDLNKVASSEELNGPSGVKSLADATVSFYGQKARSFLAVSALEPFTEMLKALSLKQGASFRIHTLSGNPFMVKLVDRERDHNGDIVGRGIDAVFELRGQQMHDLVPGLFIAKKAGAVVSDLDGNEISYDLLASKLLTPGETMRYVLASTPELANELRAVFAAARKP